VTEGGISSWRTFLANHAEAIWAADLFVVQTLTFHAHGPDRVRRLLQP
jgi:hypothetical protein